MPGAVRLRALATSIRESAPGPELPYIALEHVESGTGKLVSGFEPDVKIAGSDVLFRRGDVLFGKLRPYLAKVVAPDFNGCASGEFLVLRPAPSLEPRCLYYLCLSRPWVQWAEATSVGTKMPRTDWEALAAFRLELPSLDRQRAVADFLDRETARIDLLIEKKLAAVGRAQERMRSLVHVRTASRILLASSSSSRFHGGVPLRRVLASMKTGGTPPTSDAAYYADGIVPWYGPSSFGRSLRLRNPSKLIAQSAIDRGAAPLFPADSTLVVCIGATAGRVAHLDGLGSANQQVTCLAVNSLMLPRFLSWQLWAESDRLRDLAPRTTLPIMNNDFLRDLLVVVPSVVEQAEILQEIEVMALQVDQLEEAMHKQIQLLRERRQTLITASVTGQINSVGDAA